MKHSWTASAFAAFLAVGAAAPTAQAGPQYSAEEIIEHFMRSSDDAGSADGAAPRTRGVFVGAAGFGTEAGVAAAAASAAAPGANGASDASVTPEAAGAAGTQGGVTEAPLALPMTGAGAGQATAADAGRPSASIVPEPGGYDLLITFDLDSATLSPQARENLDAFVAALRSRALQDYRFLVEGHTDATGPADYNQRLSERRAASVVDYLVGNGIASTRVVSRGYGETRPRLADPEDPQNRRVETRRIQ